MHEKLSKIKQIGFTLAGCWKAPEGELIFELKKLATVRNVLYCFVVGGQVKYVGKTTLQLQHRMQRYKTPPQNSDKGGSTNIKINVNIRQCLEKGESVEIFVLPDNGLLHYGGIHVNLAAGLEDDLVKQLAPPWNGGKKESSRETLVPTLDDDPNTLE